MKLHCNGFSKALLVAAVTAACTGAQAYEAGDWVLRAGTATISPNEDSGPVRLDGDAITGGNVINVSEETGLGLSLTYMVNANWGVELLASSPFTHDITAKNELTGTLRDIGEATHLPPTLSVQFYPMGSSGSAWQPYLGVGVNYTIFFDEDLSNEAKGTLAASDLELSNSLGLAAQLGIDWNFSDNWLVNASVMYADLETDAEFKALGGSSKVKVNVDVDPWVYRLSVGYRF